ncbi:MAG: hypothetical protein HQ536_01910 [Parcubacteria group bacterium]|nr:hypothetical protein [Parcubacteria group bacterium]
MIKIRNNFLIFLIWGIILLLLVLLSIFYLKNDKAVTDLLVGLLGVFLMLGIALITFLKMDEATKATVKSILESSKKQLKEFSDLTQKFKRVNSTLKSVSSSLKIVADDVVAQRSEIPNLTMTFGGGQKQIRINVGHESLVKLLLENRGQKAADKPNFAIFFPPEIEIIKAEGFLKTVQTEYSPYLGDIALSINIEKIPSQRHFSKEITIKIKEGNIKLFKLDFRCSCFNAPQNKDSLLIDAVG